VLGSDILWLVRHETEKIYSEFLYHHRNWDNLVGVVRTGRPGNCGSNPSRSKTFLSARISPRRR
jgi:hypothetical protein